jgi:hypothetical protein
MLKKYAIIFICLLLVSTSVYCNKKWIKNQEEISKGKAWVKQINRLGPILVKHIENRINSISESEWKKLGLSDDKLNMLLFFNRLSIDSPFNLEDFRSPLKREVYRRLSLAMGSAIDENKKLLQRIKPLYFNVDKLAAIIGNTGKAIFSRDPKHRRKLGLMIPENAVYEIFLTVNWEDGTIDIGGKIIIIETGEQLGFSPNYTINAKKLIKKYNPSGPVKPQTSYIEYKPSSTQTRELEIAKIYYQDPNASNPQLITTNTPVTSGGQIWFQIKLNRPSGYLLAYLDDGKRFYNLFPGTYNAVINGDYLVPYNIVNRPFTSVQKTAAENAVNGKLPEGHIMIGGYTFDDSNGFENFYFHYLHKPDENLINLMKKARDTGKNIFQTKGVKQGTSTFPNNQPPFYYHSKVSLRFWRSRIR